VAVTLETAAMLQERQTLHLVFSTTWKLSEVKGKAIDPDAIKKLPAEYQKAVQKLLVEKPLCCELCDRKFLALLAKAARKSGMEVVRWPISGAESLEKLRTAQLVPGAVAMFLHAWHGGYEKECVPAWDYYPLLEALAAKHVLLYPSANLDRIHSEKRYRSALMPPTQYLNFTRRPGETWSVKNKTVTEAAKMALDHLQRDCEPAGLTTKDVMVKQGLSWGGEQVVRVGPERVLQHLQALLAKVPLKAQAITVLLQAKIDIVAELRWVILDGKLRGCGWRTFGQARRGSSMVKAGMKGEAESREALAAAGLARDEGELRLLEQRLQPLVEQVLEEAVLDAGEMPQFLRVDLLVDTEGRAWLGERESWGADLMGGTYNPRTGNCTSCDPSRAQVAAAMIARAFRLLGAKQEQKKCPQGQRLQQCRSDKRTATKRASRPRKAVQKKPSVAKRRTNTKA